MKHVTLAIMMLALAGCSQVDALAPVGGDHVSMVRFATIDVLVAAQIDIRTAPSCTEADELSTCKGATVTGEVITSESTGDRLTVKVGARRLYDGSLTGVITENAQRQ